MVATISENFGDGLEDMGQLLDLMMPIKPLRRGDVLNGVVMRADAEGVLVNIGHKAEGIVPPGEMRTLVQGEREKINVGDEIVTLVVKGETSDQAAILSIDRAMGEKGWVVLENALESGDRVTGIIRGFNRGGCLVDVEGVQGFVPMSQLVSVARENPRELKNAKSSDDSDRSEGLESEEEQRESSGSSESVDESKYIGKELPLKVLELDRGRNRAIFSERRVVHEQREEQRAKLIADLVEGETRKGKVTGISSFGAFVDLGGADGLIHVSELSWNQVRSPEEVVSIGDEIDVHILKIDMENKKIALSLRMLQPEPWQNINEQHQVDDLVDATVTKLTNFGAFARIEDSVEGLIHISELTSKVITHPKEVVKEGDKVRLRILRIEPERRRLGLSLKQVDEEEF